MIESRAIALLPIRRRRRLAWGSVGAGTVGLASLVAVDAWSPVWSVAGLVSTILVLSGAFALWTLDRDPGKPLGNPGTIRLAQDGLVVEHAGQATTLPAARIEGGYIEGGPAGAILVLQLTEGHLLTASIAWRQRVDAEALMGRLGADRQTVTVRLVPAGKPARRQLGCALIAFAVLGVPLMGAVLSLIGQAFRQPALLPDHFVLLLLFGGWLAVSFVMLRAVTPTALVVGGDGVVIRRLPFPKRFVAYHQLDDVTVDEDRLRLRVDDETITIRSQSGVAARAVAERIGRQKYLQLKAPGGELGVLRRGNQNWETWRANLRELLGEDRGYRVRSVTPEELLQIVEDPFAHPEQRVGAALAVADVSAKARARIESAAEETALTGLRVALAQAATGQLDSDALERAIEQFHE